MSDISCYNQGGVSSNRKKDYKERSDEDKQEESVDIVQDSLPLADSLEVCNSLLVQNVQILSSSYCLAFSVYRVSS